MKNITLTALVLAQGCLVANAFALDTPAKLTVNVSGIQEGAPIDAKFAFCKTDGKGRTIDGGNISPAISWSGAPDKTKSYVLIVVDRDVPANFDTANKPGQIIQNSFPRQNFYHWVLTDIPASVHGVLEGKNSNGITKGGKAFGRSEYGINGVNGYGFGGYDGPCPPWNDERIHNYHFIVYALDVPSVKLPDPIKGPLTEEAMKEHVLAQGEVNGTYTTNAGFISGDTKKTKNP